MDHPPPPAQVTFTVNDEVHKADPEATSEATALDVLRDQLGRTEVKRGCDSGVCGTCTVLCDGRAVVSCLLPARRLDGAALRTTAGLGSALHPVQRAILAHDALQCGFCTPGFVMSAVAFVEAWCTANGTKRPERDTVAEALAGNLCRCGTYEALLEAVAEACTGRFDNEGDGDGAGRIHARARVTGEARYTVDVRPGGLLHGALVRSTVAHARITDIDLAPALRIPGVAGAVELLEGERVVRYHGQAVAAVAATDEATLARAVAAVDVRYAPLAMTVGQDAVTGPAVYPPLRLRLANTGEATLQLPARRRGNVYGPVPAFGRRPRRVARLVRRAALGQDAAVVRGVWSTSGQVHTPLEPHACVAEWHGGHVTVHLSTQMVSFAARLLARRFQLPADHVTVIAEHVGGAFGAKLDLSDESIAAVTLSRDTGRPVRVAFSRSEELAFGGHRPSVQLDLELVAAARPRHTALRLKAMSYGGAAVGSEVAALARTAYPHMAKDLRDFNVIDNTPPGRPFRGPGGPALCWALEQAVDEGAHRLGVDPVELRRGWSDDPALRALYDQVLALPRWRDRPPPAADRGRIRHGIGVAAASWTYHAQTDIRVRVSTVGGGLLVETGTQDIGTGAPSVLRTILAKRFCIDPDLIDLRIGSSALPPGPVSAGSASTASLAPTAHQAADRLQATLTHWTASHLQLTGAVARPQGVAHCDGLVGWADVLAQAPELTVVGRRPKDRVRYAFPPPLLTGGLATGRGAPSAVLVTEVEVDTALGLVRVPRVWMGVSAGQIVMPALARSQCFGGITQGIGYALFEERTVDRATGAMLATSLDDYRLPGIGDQPSVEVYFEESGFGHSASPGVGVAEVTTLPVAASIGNAICHATGWRPRELPLHPWRVLAAMQG